MAKTINSSGKYARKDGSNVEYGFEYQSFDTLQDAIDTLNDTKVLACVQRMVKVDANNTAREKAKKANGDSTAVVMSEEQKAEAKAKRSSQKRLLDLLTAKGVTSESELAELLG